MALPSNTSLDQYKSQVGQGSAAAAPQQAAAAAAAAASSNGAAAPPGLAPRMQRQLAAPKRLQALLADVDPSFTLDEEAAEIVLQLVEEFSSSVARAAATAARHRGSPAIEQRDVAFALLKQWNMAVPAVGVGGAGGAGDAASVASAGGGKKGGGGGTRKR